LQVLPLVLLHTPLLWFRIAGATFLAALISTALNLLPLRLNTITKYLIRPCVFIPIF
jgi:hypothetical protein